MNWLCEQTTKTGGVSLIIGWFCGKEILSSPILHAAAALNLQPQLSRKIEIIMTIKGTT
jgi:hypothetical protein